MPRPVDRTATYRPGLDGVRALAVVAVLGYHFGIPWMSGGLLGVGVFFTLSGFLITSILMSTWERTGRLGLQRFWVRRARRLLPALLVVLAVVLAATAVVERSMFSTRASESLSAAFYISNWTTIASDVSYFDRFGGPGPLDHLWSLAVEEQFYLLWPLVLLVMLGVIGLTNRRLIRWTFALAAASFVLLSVHAVPGFDNTRAYEGTDTRAGELLIGAAFAMICRPWIPRVRMPATGRIITDGAGVAALAVVVWMMVSTTQYSMQLYHGGLLLLALSTAVLVSVVSLPESLLGRVLGVAPLRWVGERSYGIYLWHLPLVAFMPSFVRDTSYVASLLLFALTLAIAALSWEHIENPIRTHGVRGALRNYTSAGSLVGIANKRLASTRQLPDLLTGTAAVAMFAVVSLSIVGVMSGPSPRDIPSASVLAGSEVDGVIKTHQQFGPTKAGKSGQHKTRRQQDPEQTDTPDAASARSPHAKAALKGDTSCSAVVHIGDSTSIGLMSASYLPRRERIDAQYRRVGVADVETDISGARSIVETYKGEPNAFEATKARIDDGYDGCWVFAMGTNDTANQYVGGVVSMHDRIERIMDEIDGRPALWLSVKSLLSSGPWADSQMEKWNDALVQASQHYPNMRIYDWRRQVKDGWFSSDGIHFTSHGYQQRGHRIADALALAFPARSGPSRDVMVAPR